ncbi:rhomboid family intramembrane serine protease [Mucilaginibacter mali]|uniref:Rhomboid family intramembrane serine protease n=1 Tax=Mucilaginibacter mali TaxID=2740462 RepID=A0A7D4QCU4_9SPHI|nr:rhomboid family intramembrane serine protease [Mucilaginibacter mali]QKJ31324.1 rhomboid family intramembrane serine protease [Mucilaginibacter mali]
MAWGISPYQTATIPLGDYNADHYLTLLYHSFQSMGWHIGYFHHDGMIAYTNISWESYSEEVSVRVYADKIVIKSECVGYQGLFTDYGKNQKNLDLLFGEMDVTEVLLQDKLEQTAQQLMDTIPEKQFLSLADPPMKGKELLRGFFSAFVPKKHYAVTPVLVLVNIFIFVASILALGIIIAILQRSGRDMSDDHFFQNLLLAVGFSNRTQVLHGQVWRLFTNTFLHFSLTHLIGNMIVLIYIGSLIENKLGKWNFLFLYLLTGVMASMVSVMWHINAVAGGASGAIFGLFGILLALLSTNFYEASVRRALLISTAIFVGYNLIPFRGQIDHAAHLGGLASGYVLGLIAFFGLSKPNRAFKKWGIVPVGIAVATAFIVLGIRFTPEYHFDSYARTYKHSEDLGYNIRSIFYGDSVGRVTRLDRMEHQALPQVRELLRIADTLQKIELPEKQKQKAALQAQVIKLECTFYNLLYKEYKENDKEKYRPEMERNTSIMNDLRKQLANFDDDSEGEEGN